MLILTNAPDVWRCDYCEKEEVAVSGRLPRDWLVWNRPVFVQEVASAGGTIGHQREVVLCSVQCASAFIESVGDRQVLRQGPYDPYMRADGEIVGGRFIAVGKSGPAVNPASTTSPPAKNAEAGDT